MFGFLVTVFLVWVGYKFVKAYLKAKAQISSQEYGKEARHIAIMEFGVPQKFYDYFTQNSMDVVRETALDMRNSIADYKDVSWSRMLAWTLYLTYLNICKDYLRGREAAKKMMEFHGISSSQAINVVSIEILDPFKNQLLHTDVSREYNYSWDKILYEWESKCYGGILESKVRNLLSQKIIQVIDNDLLEYLPEEIVYLNELKEISIHYCYNFDTFPKNLSDFRKLEKIELVECLGLKVLPSNLFDIPHLKYINLTGLPISSLPNNLDHLTEIEELFIDRCDSLNSIGNEIGELKSLKKLNISGCSKIKAIPSALGKLVNLEELCISYNKDLLSINDSILNLSNLKVLDILILYDAVIPKDIFKNLINLNCLSIDLSSQYNRNCFRSGFEYLNKLESLYIKGCADEDYFKLLIDALPNLKILKIYDSEMREYPKFNNLLSNIKLNSK